MYYFYINYELTKGMVNGVKKQVTGYEFKINRSNLYFDPNELINKFPSYEFMETIYFSNYLNFFSDLGDIHRFISLFVEARSHYFRSLRLDFGNNQQIDRVAKQLLMYNLINHNENVRSPVR